MIDTSTLESVRAKLASCRALAVVDTVAGRVLEHAGSEAAAVAGIAAAVPEFLDGDDACRIEATYRIANGIAFVEDPVEEWVCVCPEGIYVLQAGAQRDRALFGVFAAGERDGLLGRLGGCRSRADAAR